ncbi:MAG: hypothetical protein COY74_10015, partial [Nitrosopumilales archaeon CG_4_10_14_0_8_um_filter_34_8]
MLMIFSVISINSVFAEDPPLILSKVEIWGPSSFIANNVNFCMDNTVGQLGPWAVGWIEIQNTKDKTITAENITLSDSALRSILPITLKAKESCIFQTEDQITTRIGPGGSGGNGPPYGYDGSIVVFDYTVEENGKKIPYVDTTPKISDIFGDTRIWQLVDDEWLFKEGSIGNVLQETNGVSISPDKTVYPVPWENRPPLKQIKSGVALVDVQCSDGKVPAIRYDKMRVACVSLDTESKLMMRGWATMRLAMPGDNISHALCNNYEGKWHQEYFGCRDITDFQCSLMGGELVDNLSICYNGICPDKLYSLCVTNPNLYIQYPNETEDDFR